MREPMFKIGDVVRIREDIDEIWKKIKNQPDETVRCTMSARAGEIHTIEDYLFSNRLNRYVYKLYDSGFAWDEQLLIQLEV